jgi:hypothetical protein
MAIEASFTKELSRFNYPDNCFLALFRDNENFDPSLLNIENRIGDVSLGKNDLGFSEFQYDFTLADFGKKAFRII